MLTNVVNQNTCSKSLGRAKFDAGHFNTAVDVLLTKLN